MTLLCGLELFFKKNARFLIFELELDKREGNSDWRKEEGEP